MFRVLSSSVLCSVGVLLALSMVTPAAAISVDGSVFEDQFDAALSSSLWYLPYCSSYTVHDSLLDIDNPDPGGSAQTVSLLSGMGIPDPDNYAVEVRFQVPTGAPMYVDGTTQNYGLWNGFSESTNWWHAGVDLGFGHDGTGATGATYNLIWGGPDLADPLASLTKGTFYTVVAVQTPDDNVAVYLDDVLIATRTAVDWGGGNEALFFTMGDGAGGSNYGQAQYDYVKVGDVVPEPGSMSMLIALGVSLLAYAWRRRR